MDDAVAPGWMLSVHHRHLDGHAELVLSGELDIATGPILQQRLDALVANGSRDVRLNLSALTFLDAAGVSTLVTARQDLERLGGRLSLRRANGMPLRVLGICGVLDTFTMTETITANEDGANVREPPQGHAVES